MRRRLTNGFLVLYLGFLAVGIVSNTLKWGNGSHPVMYYTIWDMFCGWASYETRNHIIAQGESGTYYQLAPGPWGYFCPYGDLPRHHYDGVGHAVHRMALNALRHTDHEPIERILIVEENWSKKFNFPEELWSQRFDEPKNPHSYFWIRGVLSESGQVLAHKNNFSNEMYQRAVINNPRLIAESRRDRPFSAFVKEVRSDLAFDGVQGRTWSNEE